MFMGQTLSYGLDNWCPNERKSKFSKIPKILLKTSFNTKKVLKQRIK